MGTTPAIVRWGILGPGRIARTFAADLREVDGAELVAVASRTPERARSFAAEFGAARAHGDYRALAEDPGVDAVYVATPHAFHEHHAVLCLRGGKHVLCEKPLATGAAAAGRMIEAARTADRALMEAMWTRFLPALVRMRELVAAGAIGDVRMIQADLGFRTDVDPAGRLFAPSLGGGALLDLGVYPLNLANWLCGEPSEVHAVANLGTTGVDEEAAILLRHDDGPIALLACALRLDTAREARILGTAGSIAIARPWWGASRLIVTRHDGPDEVLDLPRRGHGFVHEIEAFMEMVRTGQRDSDVIPLAASAAVLRVMDTARGQWGGTADV